MQAFYDSKMLPRVWLKRLLCTRAEQYPYSSAKEDFYGTEGITDTSLIKSLLNQGAMKEYIYQSNEDQCIEMEDTVRKRVTDEAAEQLIRSELGGVHPTVGKAKERQTLNIAIQNLVHSGVSIRQLSRLTGISKKIIENALR